MRSRLKVVVLSGGIGGARFLKGLRLISHLDISVIVNTSDDITLYGLRICPDLDSVIYNLAGVSDIHQGWGRFQETWSVQNELSEYFQEEPWFNLGDKDFATHIFRSALLSQGRKLHEIVQQQCSRWNLDLKIMPATNDFLETEVVLRENLSGRSILHFQEWWVKSRGELAAKEFILRGKELASPAPGVIEAIEEADLVIFAPSNPVVSIGTILQIPGIKSALEKIKVPIVGISPIIGGAPVLGMADKCLMALGFESSSVSVAKYYGSKRDGGLLDGWLLADTDAHLLNQIEEINIASVAVPLLMTDEFASEAIAESVIELSNNLRKV